MHEVRRNPLGFADNFEPQFRGQNLLPEDPQLQLRKMSAKTPMDAESEREMLPHILAVDHETVGTLNDLFVPVTRDVPHDDLVALPDLLSAYNAVDHGSAAHMCNWRLVPNYLGHGVRDQLGIVNELSPFGWVLIHEQETASNRVARGVIAPNNRVR
ncbi:hypothetical protein ACVWXP_003209 [Bradyrhizobium sp. USDA 4463]